MEFTRRNFIKTAFIGGVGAMLPVSSWAISEKVAKNTNPNYAILDMLGRIANKPMGDLIGTVRNDTISVYQANSERYISAIPNAGPFHEYKSFNLDFPFECKTSSLVPENGVVHINKQFYAGTS